MMDNVPIDPIVKLVLLTEIDFNPQSSSCRTKSDRFFAVSRSHLGCVRISRCDERQIFTVGA